MVLKKSSLILFFVALTVIWTILLLSKSLNLNLVLDKGVFENQDNEESFKRCIEKYYFWMVLSTFRQTRKLLKKSQSLHPSNLATKLDNLVLYILNLEPFIIFFIEESKNFVSNLTSAFIVTILWQVHYLGTLQANHKILNMCRLFPPSAFVRWL